MKAASFWGARFLILTLSTVLAFALSLPIGASIENSWIDEVHLRGGIDAVNEGAEGLLHDYVGRVLFAEDLVSIRNIITRHYVKSGYLSSGAVISRKQDEVGVLYVDVIEGPLPELKVTTSGRLSTDYITDLVLNKLEAPLNINQLQEAIQSAELDPHIQYLNAHLSPGEGRGSSNLVLSVVETDPLHFEIGVNNYRSPSIGETQLQFSLDYDNLSGRGDKISLFISGTEGTDGGGVAYRLPVLGLSSIWDFYYLRADSIITEKPFDEIDIESTTDTIGSSFLRSWGDQDKQFNFGIGLERKSNESSLLGQSYDFSIGSTNGESKASVLYLLGELVRRKSESVTTLRLSFRQEVNLLGLQSLAEPAADFRLLVTQLRYVRRLSMMQFTDSIWTFIVNLQSTNDSLPSFERIALGGFHSVRGYRENSLLTDSGLEILSEVEIPFHLGGQDRTSLKLSVVPFVGYGKGWNSIDYQNSPTLDELVSVGIGVRLSHKMGLTAQVFWGKQLNEIEKAGSSLQDDGLHMEVRYIF